MNRFTCGIVALTLGLLSCVVPLVATDHPGNANEIVGTWRLQVTLPPGASVCPAVGLECTFMALATATSDRTVIQTAPIPNTTIGHGVWARLGARRFVIRSTYLRLSPDGILIGSAEATTRFTVSRNGRVGGGTYENVLFDAEGNELTRFSATFVASRMEP
ncbi:MAG: hypothetical protein AB7I50_11555 [Vicinamibacterales bacterium]